MYDAFMLITGIIFVVLSIVSAFLFAVAWSVSKFWYKEYRNTIDLRTHYEDAIQRSNETVDEKFRHDLDCHIGEQSK